MKENMITRTKSVETTKEASRICQRLFPEWSKPPFMGELQNLILLGRDQDLDESQISRTGMWWMWARGLGIENTITRETKLALWKTATVASPNNPINIVTTRSPELLHAVIGNGDPSLPRSFSSLETIRDIGQRSNDFIPTEITIVFADKAIDNFEKIAASCNIQEKIEENIQMLRKFCLQLRIPNAGILRISDLSGLLGKLGNLIDETGMTIVHPTISPEGWKKIEIAHKGSIKSQQREFNWNELHSREHNLHLATTMGLVGQAIKQTIPNAVMVHNEAFIERGALNNLFTPPNDPLPVICLNDLLKNKKAKL